MANFRKSSGSRPAQRMRFMYGRKREHGHGGHRHTIALPFEQASPRRVRPRGGFACTPSPHLGKMVPRRNARTAFSSLRRSRPVAFVNAFQNTRSWLVALPSDLPWPSRLPYNRQATCRSRARFPQQNAPERLEVAGFHEHCRCPWAKACRRGRKTVVYERSRGKSSNL